MTRKAFTLPQLLLAASALLALAPNIADAQRVQNLPVRVVSRTSVGPIPGVFRPSAMLSWADAEAIDSFLSFPGQLGAVRVTLEPILTDSTSLADYRERLQRDLPDLKRLAARGATIVLTFARMPRWLASNTSEASTGEFGFSVREASPPKDLAAFSDLAYETVRAINVAQGLDVLYEFWNEPEAKIFWGGTQDELLKAYAAFASGARRADAKARVGGLGGAWNERRAGQPETAAPLLKAFIDYAGGTPRLPLDFVSWHNYPKHPGQGWDGAGQIRNWLKARSFPAQTPQIITEWNQWLTFPKWMDPPRDDIDGAAFMLTALHEMSVAGIQFQTIASLQDFNDPPSGTAFPGDFGLLTRAPMLKKAGFHAMNMLALLDGQRRVAVEIPQADSDAQGVDVLATAGAGHVSVLISRYAPPDQVFAKSLRRAGIASRAEIQISDDKLIAYAKRETELAPTDASPAVREALARARAATEQARDRLADEIVVKLQVESVGAATPYRIYRIDTGKLNPGRAYRDQRASGGTYQAGLTAARAQLAFAPESSGTGPAPQLRLPTYAVVLVVFDVAGLN